MFLGLHIQFQYVTECLLRIGHGGHTPRASLRSCVTLTFMYTMHYKNIRVLRL